MTCPGELELSRALSMGADAELTAHLAACEACRAAWEGARAAIDLARELPVAVPPAARREEVRTAVLAATEGLAHRRARRPWIVPAIVGAAAAGVAGYLAVSAVSRASAPVGSLGHRHGIVRPHSGARYLAGVVGADEVIRLSEGVVDIDVEPLHPGERFRVVVGAAEIEVHGTAFTVTASAEHLVAVAVAHGRVDLQPEGRAPVALGAGQSWHEVVATADAVERPAPVLELPPPAPRPPVAASPRPHRAAIAPRRAPEPVVVPESVAPGRPPDRPAEEVSYDEAWAALRTGDFARAANGFARVMLLAPDGPLVEDAGFWHAVALARGKRSAEAVSAFRDFLDGHPHAARAGEASAMLGWLLIDARAYDEAARRFAAASGDPDLAVRGSAGAGLGALAKRKR
jgi:hypothetical protein